MTRDNSNVYIDMYSSQDGPAKRGPDINYEEVGVSGPGPAVSKCVCKEYIHEQQPGADCAAGWLTFTESGCWPAAAAVSACESIRRVLMSLLAIVDHD